MSFPYQQRGGITGSKDLRLNVYDWEVSLSVTTFSGGSRGGSEVSTEPPFLAGYVIKLICTVKDPGFMEPPFLPFS